MPCVYIIGDSTVENGTPPFYGWGGQIQPYFSPEIRIENHAKGGRSSKSFLEEGLFAPIQEKMMAGDHLFIAFGHNDEKDDPLRHTDPKITFPQILKGYADAARQVGATPILFTSVARQYFLNDGSLLYTHGEYPQAVRDLAQKEKIPLIDLKEKTRALLLSLGPDKSNRLFVNTQPGEYESLPNGWHDKTHFSLLGAKTVAGMVAEALREADRSLAAYLIETDHI